MVEPVDFRSVRREAVDHSGFKIGNEQLTVDPVIRDIAKARAAVLAPIKRDDGQQFRLVAILGIQFVKSAGPAFTPLAGKPVRAIVKTVQPVSGTGCKVDIWRGFIINRDTENLAYFGRGNGHALRFIDPVPAVCRKAGIAQIDRAGNDAVLVDQRQAGAVAERDLDRP